MLGDEFLCQAWPDVKVTVLIYLVNVEGAGRKHSAWMNWGYYCLVLFIWKIALANVAGRVVGVNGVSQRPYELLCSPVRIFLLLLRT